MDHLGTAATGLSQSEAAERLRKYGPNEVAAQKPVHWLRRLLRMLRNPLVLLLGTLATISIATGDLRAATVMGLMIVLGVTLRFVQEARADATAEKLRAMIHVTATVTRDAQPCEVPLREVVPGDVITLAAGDMVPADVRLVAAKDLFVNQSSLTGESMPVEKHDVAETAGAGGTGLELDRANLCFLGTSVQSGSATAVAVTTGTKTFFGGMARSLTTDPARTAFDRGLDRFTWLMIVFIAVMAPL